MRILKLLTISLFLALGAWASTAFSQDETLTLDQILERYTLAIGGWDTIKAIENIVYSEGLYVEGDFSFDGAAMSMARPYYKLVGDKTDPEGLGGYMEGYDGSAWEYFGDPRVVIRTEGASSAAIRHYAGVEPPLFDYASKGSKAELLGEVQFDGQDVYVIKLTRRDGYVEQLYLNKETYLIAAVGGESPIHAFGEAVRKLTRLSEYQSHNGFLVAHRDETVQMPEGTPLGYMLWGKIEVNVELPEDWFSPPEFKRTPLEKLVEDLYSQKTDFVSMMWTYDEFRLAYPDLNTNTAMNIAGFQILKWGQVENAIALLEVNARAYPDSAETRFGLGRALRTAGRLEDAREQFNLALEFDPEYRRAKSALEEMDEKNDEIEGNKFSNQVEGSIVALMTKYNISGAAVAVMESGKITLVKGYGFADLGNAIPMTENHLFNAASISKALTAWGIMRLVDSGKIDLDAPVNQYLSRWQLPDGEWSAQDVSIRRLLSHTAGISMPSVPGFRWPMSLPGLVDILSGNYEKSTYAKEGTAVEIFYQPGQGFHYSGGGFLILELVIEEVTGMPFKDFMKNEILDPLGMEKSQYGWDEKISKQMAVPYLSSGNIEDIFRFSGLAGSALHTSANDLSKWMLAGAWENKELRSRVLSEDALVLMYSPVTETNRGDVELKQFGLGYFLEQSLGNFTLAASHSGDNAGWSARVLFAPNQGSGFVILTNSDNGGDLVKALSCLWAETQLDTIVSEKCPLVT